MTHPLPYDSFHIVSYIENYICLRKIIDFENPAKESIEGAINQVLPMILFVLCIILGGHPYHTGNTKCTKSHLRGGGGGVVVNPLW